MKHRLLSTILFCIVISASAQNSYFNYNMGYGQFLYENYSEAITLFTLAINEKPDLADAYANRGISYHRTKQLDKAIADYIKDNSLKKDRSSYNLACAYSLQGKKDEAFKILEQCQKSEYKQLKSTLESDTDFENLKSDPRWKTLLATDFFTPYDKLMIEVNEKFGAKDYEDAIKACDKSIIIDKTDKRAYISKGYLLALLGKHDEALTEYDKLLGIDPFEAYAGKAAIYYQQRKYAEALPLYESAMAKNPYYLPLYEIGMSKYAAGRKDEAVSDFKKYCEIFTKDDMTMYTCARFLYDMQRDAEAWPYAEKAIALNPEVPEYIMLRGYLNQVKKEWDAAISDYTKVITLNGSGIGEAYYKRGVCKGERFAVSKNAVDKKGFCSDMESAEGLGITEAAQYLRELCD